MKTLYSFIALSLIALSSYSQLNWRKQGFDGADTAANRILTIQMDSASGNLWQVGLPRKGVFDSAASTPNAILTDTVSGYGLGLNQSFHYTYKDPQTFGILAIRWMQKIQAASGKDGGMVEFSVDGGQSWENTFDNPHVYNYYGFDQANVDTLANGKIGFTGTDSTWKDIWLCYDLSWLSGNLDSLMIRHTFISDSVAESMDGWMMDNFEVVLTIRHTIAEGPQREFIKVFPVPASDRINIQGKKLEQYFIIEEMDLTDPKGQVIQSWKNIPTKFFIDSRFYPNGLYYLRVKTNLNEQVTPVIIHH